MAGSHMELLAPAGDAAALEAALKGGADAIYLGTAELNARRTAGNFDEPALMRAAERCHEREVKLYVTVNTLVKPSELSLLEKVASWLAAAGVDGAIVQDLGAAAALRQMLPRLALHASTQMAVHNPQGVRYIKNLGFSRAVLARELTFDEIAQCACEGVELEVFAHGALCTGCSGQCLFSSMVGGRSGNRGLCAQPCRLPYRLSGPLCEAAGDLLSPKDLMTLDHLDELKRAGARSLKLEGRLKGPDYVYAVTSAYRRALDGERVDARVLSGVFNRGYTAGYGPGVDDRALMSDPNEQHVIRTAGEVPAPRERLCEVNGTLTARVGARLALTLSDGVCQAEALGEPVTRAERRGIDHARATEQVGKTGGTPYRLAALTIDADEDAFVSAAALNALRRAALERLGKLRAERFRGMGRAVRPLEVPELPFQREAKPLLCVEASDASVLERAGAWGADELIWSPSDVTEAGLARAPGFPFTLALPPTLPGDDLNRVHGWAQDNPRIQGVLCANVAHLALKWPGEARADYAMNAANPLSVQTIGMPCMPSVELTAAEILKLPGERELLIYGRVQLMQLRHCPLNGALGGGLHARCTRCDRGDRGDRCEPGEGLDAHVLIDRKGARFPLSRLKTASGCIVRVLSDRPILLLRRLNKLPAAARWRAILTNENVAEAEAAVRSARAALDGSDFKTTPEWALLDAQPSTTGHYFRGVE